MSSNAQPGVPVAAGDLAPFDPSAVLHLLRVGVVVVDPGDASARFANRMWVEMTRQDGTAWHGQGWWDALDEERRAGARTELLGAARAGVVYQADWPVAGTAAGDRILQVTGAARVVAGRVEQLVVTAVDVSRERATTDRLSHQATHDPLTGLYNRAQFLEFVTHALAQQRREPARLDAVLFIDVDGLKQTNDRLGHAGGDRVLRAAAGRIRASVRPTDVVARYGGDEFAVLCETVGDVAEAQAIARRLSGPSREPTMDEPLRLSVGLAVADNRDLDAEALLGRADRAMYLDKQRNRSPAQVHQRPVRSAVLAAGPGGIDPVVAVAAHELRERLAVLAGHVGALRRDRHRIRAEDLSRTVEALDQQCAALIGLVGDLLDPDTCRHAPATIRLSEILDRVWATAPAPAHVTLTALLRSPDLSVVVEPRLLTEALVHLLREAYRQSRSNVVVQATGGPGWVTITVEHDAPGGVGRPRGAVDPVGKGVAGPRRSVTPSVAEALVGEAGGRLTFEETASGGARQIVWVPAAHA